MDYFRIYRELIERALDRETNQYCESHHIHPRCLGGSDDVSNLVRLLPEEHFIAHQLLVKMYPKEGKLKFALQAMLMDTGNQRRKNKAYGWVRRLVSENMRINNPNAGGKARRAYIEKHGGPPKHTKYDLTEAGRQSLSDSKVGSKNSNFGCNPWNHPRQTDVSRSIWAIADECHNWWSQGHGSYSKMSQKFGNGPAYVFARMVNRFKSGWIPTGDPEWLKFKDNRND